MFESKRENRMAVAICYVLVVGTILAVTVNLCACATVSGIGQDLQAASNGIAHRQAEK